MLINWYVSENKKQQMSLGTFPTNVHKTIKEFLSMLFEGKWSEQDIKVYFFFIIFFANIKNVTKHKLTKKISHFQKHFFFIQFFIYHSLFTIPLKIIENIPLYINIIFSFVF